jgi:hypothetical protein
LARLLSSATVLGLLAATAVAFAITEGAKLTKSPITGPIEVTKVFSPKSPLAEFRVAHVDFRLRTRDKVTVWIENADGQNVDTLLDDRSLRAGSHVVLAWDGLAADGVLAPDGVYSPVVKLAHKHLTTHLPNAIVLDTKPPKITVPKVHAIISPDGDGHKDRFTVHYRISESAHAILLVRHGTESQRVEFTRTQKPAGTLIWNGELGHPAKAVRPGAYVLSVAAQDAAGNLSVAYPFAVVTVRYVSLGRSRVVVEHGRRFAIRVSTDAPTVQWKLHGRSGVARRGTLHFTAPKTPGTYNLYVFVANHAARCQVVVR